MNQVSLWINFIDAFFKYIKALTCGSLNLVNLDQKTERDLNILFESFNSSYLLLSTSSDKNSNDKLTKDLSNITDKSKLTIQFDDAKKELVLSKTGKLILNLFYYYRQKAFKNKHLFI